MKRNLSLPQIQISSSRSSSSLQQNPIYSSPEKIKERQRTGMQSYSQTQFRDEKQNNDQKKTPLRMHKQNLSDNKLPQIYEKSVEEMVKYQQQDDRLTHYIRREQEEITTILLEDNQLIIQPKFFEKNGSMCTTELWSGTQKKEFLNFTKQEILVNSNGKRKFKVKRVANNNRKGSMPEIEKVLANIYRPDKLKNQAEVNRILEDLKQGVSIAKQSISQQIKNYENRTPLDIKVRMYHKRNTIIFDEEQADEDQQTKSEEFPSGYKASSLPTEYLAKDDQFYKMQDYGIQEVEDERLECSPVNGEYPNYPQQTNSGDYTKDSATFDSQTNDYICSSDNEENKNIKLEQKGHQLSASLQKKGQNNNTLNIQNIIPKSKYYNSESERNRNLSMPSLLTKNGKNLNKGSLIKLDKIQSEKSNSDKKGCVKKGTNKIFSLNHIPTNYNDDLFSIDDNDEGTFTDCLTNRSNNYNSKNNDTTVTATKNSEENQFVNKIKDVIEQCNQSLETNTILQKQIKKHTHKLNNRSQNFSSQSNLQKRILSSTIF